MKSFKSYLNEVRGTSLSGLLFLPRIGYYDQLMIPISSSMFKRIWPDTLRATVFHTTDGDGVKNIAKLQGQKKQISAFFEMQSRYMEIGVATQGGVHTVLEMDADIRRLLEEILEKNGEDAKDKMFGITEIGLMWSGLGKKTGGKEKSIIIKDYIDGMEKIMKKYSKPLRSVLTDYTNKKTLEPDPDSGDTAMWDELVVNNFTIQKIHVGPEFAPDFDGDDDIDGFPFELYDDVGDMVDYINRTLR